MREHRVNVKEVLALIKAVEPRSVGFRWEIFGDGLDAAESYGVLSIRRTSNGDIVEVQASAYERHGLAHATIEMLQNVLYNDGWASVTIQGA